MSRVVHFEIPAEDPQKIIQFFNAVFDWKFTQWGDEGYWLAETGDKSTPGIDGAVMKKRHPDQPMVNTIQVDDVELIGTKITEAGGEVVVPKMPIQGVGYLIFFKDPEGNIHGAMHNDPSAK